MPPLQPLEVIPTGDRLVFHVRSRSNPERLYRVDLLAHDGIGECPCPDWRARQWPRIREGGRGYCIHVVAARTSFLNDLLAEMARQETVQPSTVTVIAGRR